MIKFEKVKKYSLMIAKLYLTVKDLTLIYNYTTINIVQTRVLIPLTKRGAPLSNKEGIT